MKIPALCLVLTALVVCSSAQEPKYTNKYDSIDLDKILNNDRILTNYVNCLMESGPCTNEGRELKKTLPDALKTDCSKCSDKQKGAAEKVIRFLIKNKPKEWDRLKTKYDPTGEYSVKYQDRLDE